jgi:hypothetical protein
MDWTIFLSVFSALLAAYLVIWLFTSLPALPHQIEGWAKALNAQLDNHHAEHIQRLDEICSLLKSQHNDYVNVLGEIVVLIDQVEKTIVSLEGARMIHDEFNQAN